MAIAKTLAEIVKTVEYKAGYMAWFDGQTADNCPYQELGEFASLWIAGNDDAIEDYPAE